jgi:hypothetical protein
MFSTSNGRIGPAQCGTPEGGTGRTNGQMKTGPARRGKSMSMSISPIKLVTIAVILVLAALSVGGAVAERIDARASQDRLQFGSLATLSQVA